MPVPAAAALQVSPVLLLWAQEEDRRAALWPVALSSCEEDPCPFRLKGAYICNVETTLSLQLTHVLL